MDTLLAVVSASDPAAPSSINQQRADRDLETARAWEMLGEGPS